MPDELLDAVRERARQNRFWSHLGVEVVGAREGWVRLRVPVRDELCNAAAGGVDQTTLDLNVSFLSGTRAGAVFAEGQILRRGRSIVCGEARITDAEGRLLAVGRATYMILARG